MERAGKVGVVGAGAAGLVTARYFRDAGFAVEVWEMASDVGGTWLYSEDVPKGRGNVYRSLVTNLPKEIMQFSDLPFEEDLPSFVPHHEVARYLQQYADAFDLRRLIRFNNEVTLVERLHPSNKRLKRLWKISYRRQSGDGNSEDRSELYDIVIVCNGHFSKAFTPTIDGLDSFPNLVMHSKFYREPTPFIGKSVVLIGAGASGIDITREIAGVACKVYATVRRKAALPPPASPNTNSKTPVTDVFGHSPNLVVKIGCEIKRATTDGYIEFSDGTCTEGPVDAIIFCTGYRYSFPFLSPSSRIFLHPNGARRALGEDPDALDADEAVEEEEEGMSVWPLYEHVLHVEHPSLAFIGLNWKVLPFACFETQARFALSYMRHPNFLAWDADSDQDHRLDETEHPNRTNCHQQLDSSVTPPHVPTTDFPLTKRAIISCMWDKWNSCVMGSNTKEMKRRCTREYHLLGSHQWAYYSHLQKIAQHLDATTQLRHPASPSAPHVCGDGTTNEDGAVHRDWTRVRDIYEDVGQARMHSPDTYRQRQYILSSTDPTAWHCRVPPAHS